MGVFRYYFKYFYLKLFEKNFEVVNFVVFYIDYLQIYVFVLKDLQVLLVYMCEIFLFDKRMLINFILIFDCMVI